MTQLYVSVAIGTAATLLAAILVLLRAKFQGRRPLVALTRRWVAASTRTSGLVLGLLAVIAMTCFARIRADEEGEYRGAIDLNVHANASSVQDMASGSEESSPTTRALEALRAYATAIDAKGPSPAATPPAPAPAGLPDVNTMIAKLLERLEKQPNDVNGWKMLGWSYLNTNRPEDASIAYETALKLDPGDPEIRKALDQAESAQNEATRTPSAPQTSPVAEDIKAEGGQSDTERNSMIRGMVDRLAARLERSPNDEDGWLDLMRSRMTLGEKDAAKAALRKALETFAGNAAAKGRLSAAARELGVESN